MIDEFKKFISENNLINPGDKILLAVSGGIDSMVMSHLFYQLNYKIGIAHCNFSLRAHESDKDEEFVHRFANERNIPFYTVRFETKSFAKKNRLSVQMAARELRYTWFEEIRLNKGYDATAVAHNLNDNIETLLINLIRGTGLAGMAGMKPLSKRIIRPLLFASREEIINYQKNNNIIYREDKSNAETKYTRNKIRHLVIPVLKEINPSIETTLYETAERFSGFNEIVSEYISQLRGNNIRGERTSHYI
jgi:tRNA(Ile)-lysidine synthase